MVTSRAVPDAPSLQARLAATAGVMGLRRVNGMLPRNRIGIAAGRGLIEATMATFGPPLPRTRVTQVAAEGVRGEWVRAAGVENGDRAIYYLHGSGYVVCSARSHRGVASRLSKVTGLPVFVIDYRLAPEYPFPAAAQDAEAGYRWLLEQGYRPEKLVIGGDSAGCHLTLDLLLENLRSDIAQPAGAFMFSPLIDLTFALAEAGDRMRPDPMAPAQAGRELAELYTAGQPANSPRLQLTIPPGAALPPLFVQASSEEMLAGDARRLGEMAVAAGARCQVELWPGRIHVFQALPLLVPEAEQALRHTADFVASALNEAHALANEQVG